MAIAQSDAVTGDNIVAVWYLRDAGSATGWTMKSWLTSDVAEAIKSVKVATGVSDPEDGLWEVDAPLGVLTGIDPEQPKDYSKGVLVDDPLFPVVDLSADGEALVDILTTIGYKSANLSIDWTNGCATGVVLGGVVEAFELGMAQPMVDDAAAATATEATSLLVNEAMNCKQTPSPPCTPKTTTVTAVPVATGACNWVLTGSTTTPATGGSTVTCNYVVHKAFTQTRTITKTLSNCTTTVCTQIRIGFASGSPTSCTIFLPSGPSYSCPASPSCAGPASASVTCSAAAATAWGPWGPPCP